MTSITSSKSSIKAVCFDLMGTCLDWHTGITSILPSQMTETERSDFALEWRQAYFKAINAHFRKHEPPEDIDITHLRTLNEMLERHPDLKPYFSEEVKARAVEQWHSQMAWYDAARAVKTLRQDGLEVFVLANGTTRFQVDVVRSSGLQFDMLFSSELLGVYKPAPECYRAFLKLIKRKPEECVMVAAHAYDTRAAKEVGMKTIYVYRRTDDIEEDQEKVRTEFDVYLTDMIELPEAVSALSMR